MPGSTFVATAPAAASSGGSTATAGNATTTLVHRPRFVRSRTIEKEPPRHGEKPYEQLVAEAFDGPVLRLSEKLKLLEEADNRKIRRGDALDLIEAMRRVLEVKHAVKKPGQLEVFVRQYAAFVACYLAFALLWCVVMTLSNGAGGATEAQAAAPVAPELEMHAARVDPPLDQ